MRRRGAPRNSVHLIENGIETARFGLIGAEERTRARAALGLAPAERALLHFAWDWEVKGGPLFVETLARLDREPALDRPQRRRWRATPARPRPDSGSQTGCARSIRRTMSARSTPPPTRCWRAASPRECRSPCSRRCQADWRSSPPTSQGTGSHRRCRRGCGSRRSTPGRWPPRSRTRFRPIHSARATDAEGAHDWAVAERDVGRWAERIVGLYDEILAR